MSSSGNPIADLLNSGASGGGQSIGSQAQFGLLLQLLQRIAATLADGANPSITVLSSASNSGTGWSTSSTSESALTSLTVPANAMGPNGWIRVTMFWDKSGSSGTATPIVRIGNVSSGAVFFGDTTISSTTQYLPAQFTIFNKGVTNAQAGGVNGSVASYASVAAAPSSGTLDTTSSWTIYFNGLVANAGDAIKLGWYSAEVFNHV